MVNEWIRIWKKTVVIISCYCCGKILKRLRIVTRESVTAAPYCSKNSFGSLLYKLWGGAHLGPQKHLSYTNSKFHII